MCAVKCDADHASSADAPLSVPPHSCTSADTFRRMACVFAMRSDGLRRWQYESGGVVVLVVEQRVLDHTQNRTRTHTDTRLTRHAFRFEEDPAA